MTVTVDLFAAAGVTAAHNGELDRALAELAVRLDLAGAGGLLDELMFTCWAPVHPGPGCRCEKKPPDPRPIPRPPQPPAKPGDDRNRSVR